MNEPLLEVSGLTKRYISGIFKKIVVTAVDSVSFSVHKGETLALVGESGCGKSTIGKCVLNLIPVTSGSIRFKGQDLTRMNGLERVYRRQLQMIFQDADGCLNPRMRVYDLLLEPLRLHGLQSCSPATDAQRLLGIVNLTPDLLSRYPHELSGGQRQRIGIARTMSLEPDFIVADEPAASLDLSVQAQMLMLMKQFQREHKAGYIFISHNLNVVRLIADRIAVMYLDKFVEIGTKEEIFTNPRHPYTKALLSSSIWGYRGRNNRRIILSGEIPSPFNLPSGCRFYTRCPQAQPICKKQEPVLLASSKHHFVACHATLISSPEDS